MELKWCSNPNCSETNPQPLENFWIQSRTKDGRNARCGACMRIWWTQYQTSKKGKQTVARAKARYRKSTKNKLAQKRYRQSKKGKKQKYEQNKRYQAKHGQKVEAHKALNHAVEQGKLPRAAELKCVECEETASSYHHHLGYDEKHWLDVLPLCIRCHITKHPSRAHI